MAAQSSDPLARLMSVTAMCSHPDPNVRAMGDVALDDAFSAKYGLPAMGGCPNAK